VTPNSKRKEASPEKIVWDFIRDHDGEFKKSDIPKAMGVGRGVPVKQVPLIIDDLIKKGYAYLEKRQVSGRCVHTTEVIESPSSSTPRSTTSTCAILVDHEYRGLHLISDAATSVQRLLHETDRVLVKEIAEVLLADGWHGVANRSFEVDKYEYLDPRRQPLFRRKEPEVPEVRFQHVDGSITEGPISSVLALREEPGR
jgi:hypothetical protein